MSNSRGKAIFYLGHTSTATSEISHFWPLLHKLLLKNEQFIGHNFYNFKKELCSNIFNKIKTTLIVKRIFFFITFSFWIFMKSIKYTKTIKFLLKCFKKCVRIINSDLLIIIIIIQFMHICITIYYHFQNLKIFQCIWFLL